MHSWPYNLRMLYDVFKTEVPASEKKEIMRGRYDILLEPKDERLVETMCNLSEGIFERAMEQGMERGSRSAFREAALSLLKAGISLEIIMKSTHMTADEIRELAKENRLDVSSM